jgi:alanyl-tRNA synthetase
VRVLDIGTSRELCGGTHVARTGDIGLFKIVAEGGVAAGVRRVEAVTGMGAVVQVQSQEDTLLEAADRLKAQPGEVAARIAQLQDQMKALEKELERYKSRLAASQGDDLLGQAMEVRGIKVLAASVDGADAKALRELADKLRDKLHSCALVLGSTQEGKVALIAAVTPDLIGRVKAGELVNFVAAQVGGKGGGKPDLAQAGGSEPGKLPQALEGVAAWVDAKLNG